MVQAAVALDSFLVVSGHLGRCPVEALREVPARIRSCPFYQLLLAVGVEAAEEDAVAGRHLPLLELQVVQLVVLVALRLRACLLAWAPDHLLAVACPE